MKRCICSILLLGILLACVQIMTIPISAQAAETTKNIIPLQDGSYITVEVHTNPMRAAGTISGDKTFSYQDNGEVLWDVVLYGTFSFTGSSAICTASSCDVIIYDSTWYTVSKQATKSGSSANAFVTVGKSVSGVTTKKVPANLKLTCSPNGNLS